ncbi:neck protein [Synechococcus phage S-IOM18]|jgi:hypothetical protein|uniref:Neck protein n=1 Tax=Synechococcus phage S-IOM18 TaxID=754039 RepID=R9TN11_9CAUD|nr:head-tail adaptor Ad2 [Synechococcus phage S-IOM18]AGN33585.1 neck protein [Synechococcus phage S-IOM18]
MSATRPASKTELKNYALRRLGYPAIDINVCDEQLDDLIEEAIDYYQEYHYNGSYKAFIKIEVTDAIKTAAQSTSQLGSTNWYEGNEYVSLPPNVMGVNRVYSQIGASSVVPGNIFNIKYQIFLNDIYAMTHGHILHYFMTSQYLETLDFVTNSAMNRRVRFNEHQGRLYLDFDWGDLQAGDYILVEALMRQDPEIYTDMYNDNWMKDYVEALFQQQWGRNLSKYDGIQMLGGVTLNGRQILDDASQFKKDLEEEIRSKYEIPPMDLVG